MSSLCLPCWAYSFLSRHGDRRDSEWPDPGNPALVLESALSYHMCSHWLSSVLRWAKQLRLLLYLLLGLLPATRGSRYSVGSDLVEVDIPYSSFCFPDCSISSWPSSPGQHKVTEAEAVRSQIFLPYKGAVFCQCFECVA